MAAVCFPCWMLIDRQVQAFDPIHFVMFMAPIFAIWISWCWDQRQYRALRSPPCCSSGWSTASTTGRRIQQNAYRNTYLATTEFLKQHASRSQLVMGSAELAFQLGFDGNVVDDYRLGYRSHKKPDFIVIDKNRYEEWIPQLEKRDPAAYQYITSMMQRDFRLVLDRGNHKVYSRL